MKRYKKQKAQSILEYAVILGVIIGAILLAAPMFKTNVEKELNATGNKIQQQAGFFSQNIARNTTWVAP